jgi:hypothetical protein
MVRKLWMDEAGFVVSTELILVAVLLVIGMIAGLATIRDQVVQELGDVAVAVSDVNHSYRFSGVTGHSSSTAGSSFADRLDFCDDPGQLNTRPSPQCLDIMDVPPSPEN